MHLASTVKPSQSPTLPFKLPRPAKRGAAVQPAQKPTLLSNSHPDLQTWRGSMLRSRISRRVIAEQHIHLAQRRPGFIGVIATDFSLREAVEHAAQRTQQARMHCIGFRFRDRD